MVAEESDLSVNFAVDVQKFILFSRRECLLILARKFCCVLVSCYGPSHDPGQGKVPSRRQRSVRGTYEGCSSANCPLSVVFLRPSH